MVCIFTTFLLFSFSYVASFSGNVKWTVERGGTTGPDNVRLSACLLWDEKGGDYSVCEYQQWGCRSTSRYECVAFGDGFYQSGSCNPMKLYWVLCTYTGKRKFDGCSKEEDHNLRCNSQAMPEDPCQTGDCEMLIAGAHYFYPEVVCTCQTYYFSLKN